MVFRSAFSTHREAVAGETDDGNTFVEERSMSIGNVVFIDTNHDGFFTSGEGVVGVKVNLYDSGDTFITQTTTIAGGLYSITGIAPWMIAMLMPVV